MASAIHATNPSDVQTCLYCRDRDATRADGFCSLSCRNKSTADHSTEALMRRFWAKVDKTPGFGPNGDCWRWAGRTDSRGYGEIKVAGRYKKAHRLSLFGRDDLDNPHFACHKCDNPQCVRPDHLFSGTALDNITDMRNKGRAKVGFVGAPHSHALRKLTDDQVREIRRTGISRRKGAIIYGVSTFTIDGVKRRTLYKDVE